MASNQAYVDAGLYRQALDMLKRLRTAAVSRKKYEQIAVYFHSDSNSRTATVYPGLYQSLTLFWPEKIILKHCVVVHGH